MTRRRCALHPASSLAHTLTEECSWTRGINRWHALCPPRWTSTAMRANSIGKLESERASEREAEGEIDAIEELNCRCNFHTAVTSHRPCPYKAGSPHTLPSKLDSEKTGRPLCGGIWPAFLFEVSAPQRDFSRLRSRQTYEPRLRTGGCLQLAAATYRCLTMLFNSLYLLLCLTTLLSLHPDQFRSSYSATHAAAPSHRSVWILAGASQTLGSSGNRHKCPGWS